MALKGLFISLREMRDCSVWEANNLGPYKNLPHLDLQSLQKPYLASWTERSCTCEMTAY